MARSCSHVRDSAGTCGVQPAAGTCDARAPCPPAPPTTTHIHACPRSPASLLNCNAPRNRGHQLERRQSRPRPFTLYHTRHTPCVHIASLGVVTGLCIARHGTDRERLLAAIELVTTPKLAIWGRSAGLGLDAGWLAGWPPGLLYPGWLVSPGWLAGWFILAGWLLYNYYTDGSTLTTCNTPCGQHIPHTMFMCITTTGMTTSMLPCDVDAVQSAGSATDATDARLRLVISRVRKVCNGSGSKQAASRSPGGQVSWRSGPRVCKFCNGSAVRQAAVM
jgi:hypothetical protein